MDFEKLIGNDQIKLKLKKAIENNRVEVIIGYKDRLCKMERCSRSKKPYSALRYLLNHYKTKHPGVVLKNREGDTI